MRKPDTTVSARMAAWRKRMKEEGWRSINIWLPPESADALDTVLAAVDGSRRNTLTVTLQAGIEAMKGERNAVTKKVSKGVAEQECKPVKSNRNEVTQQDKNERVAYRNRMLLELETLRQDHLSFKQIADVWNSKNRPTLSGRGKWDPRNLHRLYKKYLSTPSR